MEYLVAAYTDIGPQKETNQDSICVRRAEISGVGEVVLAVVCDGMGGLKKGELASAAAVNAFGDWFDAHLSRLPAICGSDFSQVRLQWSALIDELHDTICRYSAKLHAQSGTTVSAFLAYADRYLTLTIGDSRIYERKTSLKQLTQDQSLVAREIAAGRITEEESRHHPQRNILLQCVGVGGQITPVFTEGRVQSDSLYLLCSDGLVHEVSPAELEDRLHPILLRSKESMTKALFDVTELCKRRGETDNITAVLLRTGESRPQTPQVSGIQTLFARLRRTPKKPEPERSITLLETAQIVHTRETMDESNTIPDRSSDRV